MRDREQKKKQEGMLPYNVKQKQWKHHHHHHQHSSTAAAKNSERKIAIYGDGVVRRKKSPVKMPEKKKNYASDKK